MNAKFKGFSIFANRVVKQKMKLPLWKVLQVPSQKLSFQSYQKWRFTLKHVQLKQGMYGQNLKGESLQLGKRRGEKPKPTRQPKPFLPLGQLCGRTGCAGRLCSLCPSRFSGSDGTKPWAGWSDLTADPDWGKGLN